MQGFRSEIENPLVQKDIIELEKKISSMSSSKTENLVEVEPGFIASISRCDIVKY